jgi:hypothetical protein
MKRLFLSCILLLTIMVSSSGSFGADWQKGMDAFNRGDYAEAVKWYRLAAEKGNAISQYNLGFLYENGQGVPQDYAEAVKWYRLAANQGYTDAMVALEFLESKLAQQRKNKQTPQTPSAASPSGSFSAELMKAKEELRKAKENAKKARRAEAELRKELAARQPVLGTEKDRSLEGIENIDFGPYYALVIGINKYKYLLKLKTAVNDAKTVAHVLKEDYGFKVTLLLDVTNNTIIDTLDEYRETLGPKDNLLIYYAGHGWLDEEVDRGYWLPVNARPKRRSSWVSNATITDTLKGLDAKHVMVVADSCYSGTLVRSATMGQRTRTGNYWKRMAEKWARVAITSGGLEPVADKGGGDHSPFAKAFIDALKDNNAVMDGTQLFNRMRRPVMVAAEQTPQYSDVRSAGHDGGDFLFVRNQSGFSRGYTGSHR